MCQVMQQVAHALADLTNPPACIGVAVSGGPDSQALLDLLAHVAPPQGITVAWAVGVDHGLRPEAAHELAYAAALAAQHQIPYQTLHVHLPPQGNLLQQARKARYAALKRFAEGQGLHHVALGHTATDQAETILIHLSRGCGLQGAAGMQARHGILIRPLLACTRAQVLDYLKRKNLRYAIDPSNKDLRRARARLRAYVLPGLQSLNRQFIRNMGRFAALAHQDERYLTCKAQQILRQASRPYLKSSRMICQKVWAHLPPSLGLRLLRLWLKEQGCPPEDTRMVQMLWDARDKRSFQMTFQNNVLYLEHGVLGCIPLAPYDIHVPIPGHVHMGVWDAMLTSALVYPDPQNPSPMPGPRFMQRACKNVAFDADRLHFNLKVRPWRQGDRFQPFGFNGHTKVGDFFTNAKIPRAWRVRWPVLAQGSNILWVVGLRRGAQAPVTHKTRCIVQLEVDGALPGSVG